MMSINIFSQNVTGRKYKTVLHMTECYDLYVHLS